MPNTPFDANSFYTQRAGINSAYKSGLAGLNEQKRQFQVQMPLQQQQFDRSWQQAASSLPNGLGRRGLLNSGVYRRALKDFGDGKANAQTQLQMWIADQTRGFAMGEEQLGAQRQAALDALQLDRKSRRSQTAAMLRQLGSGG